MNGIDIFFIILIMVVITLITMANISWDKERKILDNKYNVEKFPVISPAGNQYYAEIVYNHERFSYGTLTCNIYQRVIKKNGKFKDEEVGSKGFDFVGVSSDYITVVKGLIQRYEDTKIMIQKHEESRINNKKLFNDWDGIIK